MHQPAAPAEADTWTAPFPLSRVIDLTEPGANRVYNMTVEEARERIAGGDAAAVSGIDGAFPLLGRRGNWR